MEALVIWADNLIYNFSRKKVKAKIQEKLEIIFILRYL